jgi:hypothetical protein
MVGEQIVRAGLLNAGVAWILLQTVCMLHILVTALCVLLLPLKLKPLTPQQQQPAE